MDCSGPESGPTGMINARKCNRKSFVVCKDFIYVQIQKQILALEMGECFSAIGWIDDMDIRYWYRGGELP